MHNGPQRESNLTRMMRSILAPLGNNYALAERLIEINLLFFLSSRTGRGEMNNGRARAHHRHLSSLCAACAPGFLRC
jgi:hypothetical protein